MEGLDLISPNSSFEDEPSSQRIDSSNNNKQWEASSKSAELASLVERRKHMQVADFLKRDAQGANPRYFEREYELALSSKDACLIKLFLMHHQQLKRLRYIKFNSEFFSDSCLRLLPDVKFTVKWHCDSDFIPFLSKLAPHDTIKLYKSQRLNMLRVDFQQGPTQQSGTTASFDNKGRRPMSLLFQNERIVLVDHANKTVSCDLYDLLSGCVSQSSEQDDFDGQAFELANASTVHEKQKIQLLKQTITFSSESQIKAKMEIALQNWEKTRLEVDNPNEQPQLPDGDRLTSSGLFKNSKVNEKVMNIEVILKRDRHLRHKHLLSTLKLLSLIYPEVRKAYKLCTIIMQSQPDDFIPSMIKIPVVSSLGIKAVIQIGDPDFAPMSTKESQEIFVGFRQGFQNLSMTVPSSILEQSEKFSARGFALDQNDQQIGGEEAGGDPFTEKTSFKMENKQEFDDAGDTDMNQQTPYLKFEQTPIMSENRKSLLPSSGQVPVEASSEAHNRPMATMSQQYQSTVVMKQQKKITIIKLEPSQLKQLKQSHTQGAQKKLSHKVHQPRVFKTKMQEVLKTETVPDEPSTGKIPVSTHNSIIPNHPSDFDISDEAQPVQHSRQMQFNFPHPDRSLHIAEGRTFLANALGTGNSESRNQSQCKFKTETRCQDSQFPFSLQSQKAFSRNDSFTSEASGVRRSNSVFKGLKKVTSSVGTFDGGVSKYQSKPTQSSRPSVSRIKIPAGGYASTSVARNTQGPMARGELQSTTMPVSAPPLPLAPKSSSQFQSRAEAAGGCQVSRTETSSKIPFQEPLLFGFQSNSKVSISQLITQKRGFGVPSSIPATNCMSRQNNRADSNFKYNSTSLANLLRSSNQQQPLRQTDSFPLAYASRQSMIDSKLQSQSSVPVINGASRGKLNNQPATLYASKMSLKNQDEDESITSVPLGTAIPRPSLTSLLHQSYVQNGLKEERNPHAALARSEARKPAVTAQPTLNNSMKFDNFLESPPSLDF